MSFANHYAPSRRLYNALMLTPISTWSVVLAGSVMGHRELTELFREKPRGTKPSHVYPSVKSSCRLRHL